MRSKRGKWIRETQPSLMTGSNQDISRTTRQQRNLAEKQRRDRLNGYINELAKIVPLVTNATRRMDKTSILRLSAAQLRIYQAFAAKQEKRQRRNEQDFIRSNHVNKLLEDLGGFLLLTTGSGKILYISPSVEQHLGHRQTDMIGHSLLLFIHPSDVEGIYKQLESQMLDVKKTASAQQCQFICQLKEQQRSHAESSTYQTMKFTGRMTFSANHRKADDQESSSLDFVLKAFVQPLQTQIYKEMSLTDAIQDEYITRHNQDGTIVFADHRLSTITGHLPHEVCGNSAYKYIISDDILIAMFAHKMMLNNGRGFIVYRLQTRNNDYIYLQTRGYIQYQSSSSEIEYFTCVNKLLTEEEGNKELQKFNDRFSPHISQTTASTLYEIISSPQETKGFSSPTLSEDRSFSPSENHVDDTELFHKISVLTPKMLLNNEIIKESLPCSISTNVSNIMPTSDRKSSWTKDWQNDKIIKTSEYSQPNIILPNGKTKVYSETNKDIKKRLKTICDIENSYYNSIQKNGNEIMETEKVYDTDLVINQEKHLYCDLDVYNSMFHLNFLNCNDIANQPGFNYSRPEKC